MLHISSCAYMQEAFSQWLKWGRISLENNSTFCGEAWLGVEWSGGIPGISCAEIKSTVTCPVSYSRVSV